MGKVFTWNEIKTGKIPMEADWGETIQEIRTKLAAENTIIGAMLCGSSLFNAFNVRSDIDCVVLIHSAWRRPAIRLLQEIHERAKRKSVKVEFTIVEKGLATFRNFSTSSFYNHLQIAAKSGGIIKKNILDDLPVGTIPTREDLAEYIRFKMSGMYKKLIRLSSMNQADYCEFLQMILETPMHVARSMLLHLTREKIDLEDGKKFVIQHYPNGVGEMETAFFLGLCALDKKYSEELERQMKNISKNSYKKILNEIERAIYDLLLFLNLSMKRILGKSVIPDFPDRE